MSSFWRAAIFLLFVIAFLISAPLLVLYTAGYRFDVGSRRIVHTASFTISSIPRNASITIDSVLQDDRTPAVLERILPGEHEVTLARDGYLPWVKRLSFGNREAVIIQDVVLWRDAEPEVAQVITPTQTSVSPDARRLAYLTQQSSWVEVWATDGSAESTKLLMRLPYDSSARDALGWSANGTYLSLARSKGTTVDLTVVNVLDGSMVDLEDSVVDGFWWDAGDDSSLFVRIDDVVQRAPLEGGGGDLPFSATRVRTFDERDIFWEESNNRVVVSFHDGDTASILTYLPLGNYEFLQAPLGLIALYDRDRSQYILLKADDREQPILLNEEATEVAWNQAGDALLFTSGYDLKLYRPDAHEIQTLTRLSAPIEHIGWYPRGRVLLYQTEGHVNAMNLSEPSPWTQTVLAQDVDDYWLTQDGEGMFLLAKDTDGLSTIMHRQLQ